MNRHTTRGVHLRCWPGSMKSVPILRLSSWSAGPHSKSSNEPGRLPSSASSLTTTAVISGCVRASSSMFSSYLAIALTAVVVEQRLRPLGYPGGHSILRECVQKLRPQLTPMRGSANPDKTRPVLFWPLDEPLHFLFPHHHRFRRRLR